MRKFTFVLIGLIALVACEAELETERANNLGNENVLLRNGSTISPDAAAALAVEFRNSILNQSGQTRGKINEKGVASVYAWRSSEIASKTTTRSTASDLLPDTLLYIVNFEDSCGFALVSADAQIADVAAYVEKGTLTPNQEIDNPGFKAFLEGYGEYARGIRDSTWKMPDSLLTIDTLHNKINNPLFGGENVITPVNNVYHLVYYVAPLLTTEWGQGIPYNLHIPNYMYAGCTAIAIAQIAAFHQYPANYDGHIYDWDSMLRYSQIPNYGDIRYSAADLVYDAARLVYTQYGYEASIASYYNVPHCWDEFGYHYTQLQDVDFETIKTDISNGYPVFMRGRVPGEENGHAWVVDGVAIKRHRLAQFNSIPDREYIHCNWGWEGNCDGYFILGAFETRYNITTDSGVGGYNAYNENIWIYHNIYPNIN